MRADELSRVDGAASKNILRQSYGLLQSLGVLILLIVVMSALFPAFRSGTNVRNLMSQMAVNLIVAAGMTIIMISGEFDIAVGSVVALSAAASALLMRQMPPLPAFLLTLIIGPVLGLASAYLVTKGQVPSFIITLGGMMIARSMTFVITEGRVISNIPVSFKVLGQSSVLGIPTNFLIAVAAYLIGWFILRRTTFGKKVYAVGSNRTVASLSGIRVDWVKMRCFMIVGLASSLGGNLLLSRVGAIQADTGKGLEFEVIAAVVIGGTSLNGGQGNILRTVIGVVIIALIRNFLNLSHINIFWQDFATGSVIVAAVLLDALQKRVARRYSS